MNKYVRYAIWLSKVALALGALIAFARSIVTNETADSALSIACIAMLFCLEAGERIRELDGRIAQIERRQKGGI